MPAKTGFQLQDGDIELLHSVYQLRLATIDHFSVLSGRSVRALWGRLLKLKQRHHLASVARFMQKQVYAIGREGVAVLIEQGYAPTDLKEKRLRHHELTEIGIRHSLFIADIHSRMIMLTRTGPIKLIDWQEGSALWDSVVSGKDDLTIPVRPDAYFILKHTGRPEGKNLFHVFLEADRSTMSHERMATKIVGYVAYYSGVNSLGHCSCARVTRSGAEQGARKDVCPYSFLQWTIGAIMFGSSIPNGNRTRSVE